MKYLANAVYRLSNRLYSGVFSPMVLKMSESMAPIVRSSRIRPSFTRVAPESAGGFERVDTGGLPPCALVAGAMDCAVMGAAQRYSEFVARLAAERLWLHVAKMMRVRWVTLPY